MTVPERENPYAVGPAGPVYLTTEELSERFRTSPSSVAEWRARGEGPLGIRFGRRVLYPLPAVEAWEAEQIAQAERDQRRRANPLSSVASLGPRGDRAPRRASTSPATRPDPRRTPGRAHAASSASTNPIT